MTTTRHAPRGPRGRASIAAGVRRLRRQRRAAAPQKHRSRPPTAPDELVGSYTTTLRRSDPRSTRRMAAFGIRAAAVGIAREGEPVRYLRSTVVPADESLLCLLEAPSDDLVRAVYARAGVPFERLTAVISDDTSSRAEGQEK